MRNRELTAVDLAEREVIKEFREKAAVLLTGDIKLSTQFSGFMYLRDGYPSITMYVDILGEPVDVRLLLDGPDRLQVGWGGNNLLTTNDSINDKRAIELIKFVSQIFTEEAKWRELLGSLDVRKVEEAIVAEDKEKAELSVRIKETQLKAYEDAGIKVGTVIVNQWKFEEEVKRISGVRVQVGKTMLTKEEVGQRLLEGQWQVKH